MTTKPTHYIEKVDYISFGFFSLIICSTIFGLLAVIYHFGKFLRYGYDGTIFVPVIIILYILSIIMTYDLLEKKDAITIDYTSFIKKVPIYSNEKSEESK